MRRLRALSEGRHALLTAAAACVALAVVATLLVEAWVRDSPARWVAAMVALPYLGLTAALWRRLSHAAKAAVSLIVTLALLALMARVAGTQAGGEAPLGPVASRLATLLVAAAVARAATILTRLGPWPPPVRAGVGILALYCLIPYAVGFITGRSFAAIQRGEVFLPALPYWLSGPALGTFVLLPLGTVAALYRLLKDIAAAGVLAARRRAWPAAALGLSLLLALPQSLGRDGTLASPGDPAHAAAYRPPIPRGVLRTGTPLAPRISGVVQRVEAVEGLIDRRAFDVAALAESLPPSVEALAAFVREEIAYEPYEGILRGSAGALIARAGNAYDRSLLLAELLRRKGFRVRFARGTLVDGVAERLYQEVFRPVARPAPRVREAQVTQAAGVSPEQARRYLAALAPYVRDGIDVARLTETSVEDLRRLITPARQVPPPPGRARALAAIRDHVWVQVDDRGEWRDLEVAFRDGMPPGALAGPPEVLEELPESLAWRFALRVALTAARGGARTQRTVLEWEAPAGRLTTSQVIFAIAPADAEAGSYTPERFAEAQRFAAVIAVDGTARARAVFTLGGEVESSGPGGRVRDLLSRGRPVGDPPGGGVLEALHATYATISPSGLRDERTRLLYAAPAGADDPADLAPTKFRLVGSYWIQVYGGALSPLYALHRIARLLLQNRELLEMATGERPAPPVEELAGVLARAHTDPIQLLVFAALSATGDVESRDRRQAWRVYQASPNVVVYRTQGVGRGKDGYRFEEAFDVVHDAVAVLSRNPAGEELAFDLRLRRGAFLTGLELALHRDRGRAVTAQVVLEQARRNRIPLRVLTSRDRSDLARLPLHPFDRSSVEAGLERGEIIVVPERRVPVHGQARMGWIRVDPAGHALGIMEGGGGQTSVERTLVVVFLVGGGVNAVLAYFLGCGRGLMSGVTSRLTGAECLAYVACNFIFGGLVAVFVFLAVGDEIALLNGAFETYVVTGTFFTSELAVYGALNAMGAYATEWVCQGLTGQGWGPPLFSGGP